MPRISIDGTLFDFGEGCTHSKMQIRQLFKDAKKERAKLRKKLIDASSKGQIKNAQHSYVSSRRVRFSYLIEAGKKAPPNKRPTIAELDSWSKTMKLHEECNEKVRVRFKVKADGNKRYYCVYGARHKSMQRIVSTLLEQCYSSKSFQFNVKKSGGVRSAIRRSVSLMGEGFIHARRLDIKKFFDNFQHDAMTSSSLGIGTDLIQNVILGKHHEYDVVSTSDSSGEASLNEPWILLSHKGIPQGSASSQIVADITISRLKFVMPAGTRLINYVDDFLVLSKSSDGLDKAEKTLRSAVSELPFGTFELLEKSSGSISFSEQSNLAIYHFLGHVMTVSKDGNVVVEADQANLHKINFELAKMCTRMDVELDKLNGHMTFKEEARYLGVGIAHYILCWLRTFDQVTDKQYVSKDLFAYLLTAISDLTFLNADTIIAIAKKLPHKDAPIY